MSATPASAPRATWSSPTSKRARAGLRDLHTLFWMARHRYGFDNGRRLRRRRRVHEGAERFAFAARCEFLWTVRCHLHFLTGPRRGALTFDVQPELAKRLGYRDRANACGRRALHEALFPRRQTRWAMLTRIFCASARSRSRQERAARLVSVFLPAGASVSAGHRRQGLRHRLAGRLNVESRPCVSNGRSTWCGCSRSPTSATSMFIPMPSAKPRRVHAPSAPQWRKDDEGATPSFLRTSRARRQRRPGACSAVDERSRRAREVRARVRPHRRADAVQHVPPLHGGRAHAASRSTRCRRSSTVRTRSQHPLSTEIFSKDHQPPRALSRHVAARHRQGRRRSADRRRNLGARRVRALGPAGRKRSISSAGWSAIIW